MALKIIKSSEPIRVERINVCIYGQPGAGKTSLAFTSDSPLLLDFDNGSYRAANRKDSVKIDSWSDISQMTKEDLEPYKTIVVDTAGRALDLLTLDILRRDPKAGNNGALGIKGFGVLKSEFIAWLKQLNSFGKDVVLIAHMDEQKKGDDIIERLDVQGGSKGEIYKSSDAMGRIYIKGKGRALNFSPSDTAFGKNPGQLDVLEFSHPTQSTRFLADVIQSIKDNLNQMTEEQVKAQQNLEEWRAKIEAFSTIEDFNGSLEEVKRQPVSVRSILAEAAKAKSYNFDKETARFTA